MTSLAVLFVWIGIWQRAYAVNESTTAGNNSSEAELVLNCNAGQSAAGFGLTWLSLLGDLPPKSVVKYAGLGSERQNGDVPQCSLGTPDLCGWVLEGKSVGDWAVTSTLDQYLGPILDYRWEGFASVRTDGSHDLQKPVLVAAGTVAISIKAARDAHIKLSLGEDPTSSPAYYIILGGWLNTVSVIRRCPRGIPAGKDEPPVEQCYHRRQQIKEPNVLSPWQWRHFIISLSSDGEVSVSRTTGPQFLRWKDPESFVLRKGIKKAFYLNFRTQGVVGHWKIHATSHSLIKPNNGSQEVSRIFSTTFKISQSTVCVTLLHFLTTWKNIPKVGLLIERKNYITTISQQIGKNKGWTLIKYVGKVPKENLGKNANFAISVNRNFGSPIAIQDFRSCPKLGLRRTAQLRVPRNKIRQGETFACLPLPDSKKMFLHCPPVKMETIDGVCVSTTNSLESPCRCKYTQPCSPPCNVSSANNSSPNSCQPDPETCNYSPFNTSSEKERVVMDTTTYAPYETDGEETSDQSSTEITTGWATSPAPEATVAVKKELVRPKAVQDLRVTSRSYSWLKIRWLSFSLDKLKNCSSFHISWWKSDEKNNVTNEEKWEQTLEIGAQTMCPGEEENYFCGTLWNLEPSQNYAISVKPQCSANETVDDAPVLVTSETRQVPWGPSHVYVANRTETAIKLIWKARIPPSTNDINTFSVFYRESLLYSSNHTWNVVKISFNEDSGNFTCQIKNLTPGGLYEFCIHLDKLGDNVATTGEEGGSTGNIHHPAEVTFTENLRSVCTYTRTLLEKPYIPNGTIQFRSCSWTIWHPSQPITLNFNHSVGQDQLRTRAYLLCLTNIPPRSKTFDQHIYNELLKELEVKELHIAAELDVNLHKAIEFYLGDGAIAGSLYGNFTNVPLNLTQSVISETAVEVMLVAVNDKNGGRRYSWQKALYPPNCRRQYVIFLLASIGGVILFLLLLAAGIFLWKYRKNQKVFGDCFAKIRSLCCERNNFSREWKGLTGKGRNVMHLEPIEPDDQTDYSADNRHGGTISQATIFS
ncbi:uncharacterized protein LOC124158043 [Ischnura elegans]|uniref:uncharacterized protein LOC124158043 n=1 Tax=Ischnura elegans TaxID=197161 RepID=UPI001ED86C5C|nr:uncharacterized protein LOC124158043 [Ischnura elegans]